MKLYTEEQVRLLLSEHLSEYSVDKCLRDTEHIELPSDEEIDDKIEESSYSLEYDAGFRFGIEWVIEQIK